MFIVYSYQNTHLFINVVNWKQTFWKKKTWHFFSLSQKHYELIIYIITKIRRSDILHVGFILINNNKQLLLEKPTSWNWEYFYQSINPQRNTITTLKRVNLKLYNSPKPCHLLAFDDDVGVKGIPLSPFSLKCTSNGYQSSLGDL